MKVAAVVVSHGHPRELEESLPALAPQVDELVVIANVPGSVPDGVDAVHNERPLGFGANVNRGVARDDRRARALREPGRGARARRGRRPARRSWRRIRAAASPARAWSSPTARCSRRAAASRPSPARSCGARRCACVVPQRRHYHLDEAPPDEPVEADWMLGGFLLLRRAMLDELGGFDEGFRLYGEDIDLQYRAMRAGWERWYVPQAVVRHEHKAETDKRWLTRRTLWHWAGIAALRAQASRAAEGAVSSTGS